MRHHFVRRVPAHLSSLLVLLLVFGACGPTESTPSRSSTASKVADSSNAPSNYHFQLQYEDAAGIVEVLINEFPVERGGGRITSSPVLPQDLNTALIGEGNRLTIHVEPRIRPLGGTLSVASVKLHGRVTRNYDGNVPVEGAEITSTQVDSAYQAWIDRAEKQWRAYRSKTSTSVEALDSIRAWASRNPMTVSTTFDNEAGPDFSRIFEEAPVLEDAPATRKRLKDYAMHLRDLFARQDTLRLYRAHRPKFEANDLSKEKALEAIGANWFKYDWHTDFDRSALAARQWSGGRVWEIYRDDALTDRLNKEALLLAGEKRLTTWHTVYVAELDGSLKVVR